MPVYTDAIDIRQHLRGATGLTVPQIEEIMEEVEYYISTELDIDPLPPDNPLLRSMVRELTLSRAILDLMAPSSETLGRADVHRRNGMDLLASAKREGIFPSSYSSRDAASEVYSPREVPIWSIDEFLTFNE